MPKRRARGRKPKEVRELRIHSGRRLAERYDIHDHDAPDRITAAIRDNQATFLWRESGTRTHWLVPYGDTEVVAVYHKPVSFICTVLPRDAITSYAEPPRQAL